MYVKLDASCPYPCSFSVAMLVRDSSTVVGNRFEFLVVARDYSAAVAYGFGTQFPTSGGSEGRRLDTKGGALSWPCRKKVRIYRI